MLKKDSTGMESEFLRGEGRSSLVLLILAVCLFLFHVRMYWGWAEDDAFITFRYGQNFAQGLGLVFNPGERVEGFSNFGWVLLAALSSKLGLDPLLIARLVGASCGVGVLVFSRKLATLLLSGPSWVASLAPVFLALSPLLPRHAVTGLETVPFAFLLIAGVVMVGDEPPRGVRWLIPVLLVSLTLMRPEGWAFSLLLVVLGPSGSRKRGIAGVLILGLILTASRLVYFGDGLPNTFHAKVTGDPRALLDGLVYTRDFLRDSGGLFLAAFFLAALLNGPRPRLWVLLATCLGLQTGIVLAAGGDWMHFSRFYVPVFPLLAAGMAAGIHQLWGVLARRRPSAKAQNTVAIAFAMMVSLTMGQIYRQERAYQRVVLPHVRNATYLTDGYRKAAHWLLDHTQAQDWVAVCDVGVIGFVSQRPIMDMFGLIDRHVSQGEGRQHFKSDPQYILSRQPEVIILVSDPDGNYLRVPDAAMAATEAFADGYLLAQRLPIAFRNESIDIYRRRSHRWGGPSVSESPAPIPARKARR